MMRAIDGQPILTAAQMRAAEHDAIGKGCSVDALMAEAGRGIAEVAHRLAAGADMLIVCGPGNNGGDGYVAAAELQRMGATVRVAGVEPKTDAALAARTRCSIPVEALADAAPATILIDCLFGTGLSRPLSVADDGDLTRLADTARLVIAADVPSGTNADTAEAPKWAAHAKAIVTLALGALKPAHVLQPAAAVCGTVRLIDLSLADRNAAVTVAGRPDLPHPGPTSHKYTRGMVAIVVGDMEGAARLAAIAALRSVAGYVALYGGSGHGGPDALVHRAYEPEKLADRRIGGILIGPGLGRDDDARGKVDALIAADRQPLVIDGDALHLVDPDALRNRRHPIVLTPHAGEFHALFGTSDGSLLDQARVAAIRAGSILVLKGPTTIVTDGTRTIVHPGGNPWLSTAGTGDVLAGTIAAQLAHPRANPLDAASAGVWLHAQAARRLGASFIADDLANALTAVRAGA